MIIIQHPLPAPGEEELLQKLGFEEFVYSGDTTLEECLYPNDKLLNIGHFNGCLIISDDYQLTESLELSKSPQLLSAYEEVLTTLYPDTEILTVACHSSVNYHMYSLVKAGKKMRFKKVVHGEPLIEHGGRIEEEERVYADSKNIDGQLLFRSSYRDDEIYDNTEDQMMEDFAFGVAKRHLGVMITSGEEDDLMFETPFRKYVGDQAARKRKSSQAERVSPAQQQGSWLTKLFKKR